MTHTLRMIKMREISFGMARYFVTGGDKDVYLLYDDGSEGMANNLMDLVKHEGIYGVEDFVWHDREKKSIKCSEENITQLFELLDKGMCDANGRGEFDREFDLRHAVNRIIDWMVEQ